MPFSQIRRESQAKFYDSFMLSLNNDLFHIEIEIDTLIVIAFEINTTNINELGGALWQIKTITSKLTQKEKRDI